MGQNCDEENENRREYLDAQKKIFIESAERIKSTEIIARNNIFLAVFFLAGFLGILFGYYLSSLDDLSVKDVSPIMAVLCAGIISLLISEQSKENELNKHREKWCSDLRIHYSVFSSAINSFSRKAYNHADKKRISVWDAFNVISNNIKECNEEMKEIERAYHLLSFYLLSKDNNEAENKLFDITEELVVNLRLVVLEVDDLYERWKNVDNPIASRSRQVNKELEKLVKVTTDDLIEQSYCVKVYLDREWARIKEGYYGDNNKKKCLLSALCFLISIFLGYIVF